jgi:hypothetical protein
VIGVSATDADDALADFSNRGPEVFLAAPGVALATTEGPDGYTAISGTSPAAALTAGAAALLKAFDPTLTNGVLIGRLARGAAPVGDPADPDDAAKYGYGRLSLSGALADAQGANALDPVEPLGAVAAAAAAAGEAGGTATGPGSGGAAGGAGGTDGTPDGLYTSAATPTVTIVGTSNLGANQVTLSLQSSQTGTGYLTLLTGSGTACGTGTQVKAGQTSTGSAAFRRGSLKLTANVAGAYTVRNLVQSTAYTACFTADDGVNLQATPVRVNVTTTAAATAVGATWGTAGSAGFSAGSAYYTSLAIAPDGTPYVGYGDGVYFYKTSVRKYDGTDWVKVGSLGFSAGFALQTSLAFAPDGTPYLAFAYSDGTTDWSKVMKYSGSAWVSVGAAAAGYNSSFAFSPDGTPYLAYTDRANDSAKATVVKYSGASWITAGNAEFTTGYVQYNSLAFAADGTPYLAYQYAVTQKAEVMKLVGSNWIMVGSAGFSAGSAAYISLAFAPNGTPYVAYQDGANSSKATVMKFTTLSATTTTTVAATPNPATFGAAVTLTATLSPTTATGSVTFKDGTTTLGTGTLAGGIATYVTSALTVGGHSITAVYDGATGFSGSTSAAYSLTINKAGQTITFANPGTKTYGTSPTLTATATSTLAVTFTSTTPTVCTITSGGVLTFGGVGPCTIAADQGGNANFNAATRVTQGFEVAKATPSVSAWPTAGNIHYGQTLAASALSGGTATPAGGFAFTTPSTAPPVGTASQGVTFTPTDTAHYNSAAGTVSVTVTRAATSAALNAAPNPATLGQPVLLTATVTPAGGTGTVTFMDGGTTLGTGPLSGGTATLSTSALTAGSHSLSAVYAGDANYQGATSPVLTQVVQVPVTVGTNVAGLSVSVDGSTQVAPYTGAWTPGSSHTIAVSAVQGESAGSRYAFSAWSDGGALSHTVIAPASAATYTANYGAQYQVTTAASPVGTASVSWSLNGQSRPGNWFAPGTAVAVQAFATAPNAFSAWSGGATSSANPVTVTVNGPLSLTANTTVPAAGAVLTPGAGIGRSGAEPTDRTWSFTLTNNSGVAAGTVQITGVVLTPSPACTVRRLTELPVNLGTIAANGGTAAAQVHIDFSACPPSTKFKASFTYTFAGAGSAPTKTYGNQFR